jgi:hypothetical protein
MHKCKRREQFRNLHEQLSTRVKLRLAGIAYKAWSHHSAIKTEQQKLVKIGQYIFLKNKINFAYGFLKYNA